MSLSIYTEYSLFFIVPCLLVAGVLTWFLYKKDKRLSECPKQIMLTMQIMRFATFTILFFFLLRPFVKMVVTTVKKPTVVYVQDISESIALANDSITILNDYKANLKKEIGEIEKKCNVEILTVGENIQRVKKKDIDSLHFSDKKTTFTSLFAYIEKAFASENIGSVILASDGLYNEGFNPVYEAEKSGVNYPIYSVAMGDSVQAKDYAIQNIIANKIAFTSSKIPVNITLSAKMLEGEEAKISIYHKGKELVSESIAIENNNFASDNELYFDPPEKGMQTFIAQVSTFKGEKNIKNNIYYFTIEILDERKRILCLYDAPHPDLMTIKSVLEKNMSIESEFSLASRFEGNIEDFNMIILYQMPSGNLSSYPLIETTLNAKIPTLFILGPHCSIEKFNGLNLGISISSQSNSTDAVTAELNKDFSLFSTDAEILTEYFSGKYPLIVPFGKYGQSKQSQVLLYQKIGSIVTDKPLICFIDDDFIKRGFISGEGIWRWRMHEIKENGSAPVFEDLMSDIVEYLALKLKRERFVLEHENIFNETEKLTFNAEVYDGTYSLDNSQEIKMIIANKDENQFAFTFTRTKNRYFLDAGILPIGEYTYTATVVDNNENILHTKHGSFQILPVNIETKKLTANYSYLRKLAHMSNGQLVMQENINTISDLITNNTEILPVSYSNNEFAELISSKWLFYVICFLIILEWTFRRFYGGQ